jgi:protein SPT2
MLRAAAGPLQGHSGSRDARLPGGGINITASRSQAADGSAGDGRSVQARLAAMPITLAKLNTVKRETRTIDEILRDRAKACVNKTLEGGEALDFHHWFGTKPKGANVAKTSSPPRPAHSGASMPTAFPHRADTSSSELSFLSPCLTCVQ